MAASIALPTTAAVRQRHLLTTTTRTSRRSSSSVVPRAKLELSELLGGRGLCNGEQGIRRELQKPSAAAPPPTPTVVPSPARSGGSPSSPPDAFAFEKELLGLTGGFPGGEKGLALFLRRNKPPANVSKSKWKKPIGPGEVPVLMPGMIVMVSNPGNPFYMYTGIVQRVTDGKAGVLFEGGNWDKLLTFQLHELQRRDRGPPMVNPKSAVLQLDLDLDLDRSSNSNLK